MNTKALLTALILVALYAVQNVHAEEAVTGRIDQATQPEATQPEVTETEITEPEESEDERWERFRQKYEGTIQVKAEIYEVTDQGVILVNGYVAKCRIDEERKALTLGKKDHLGERFIYVYTDPKEHKKGKTYKGLVYSCKHSQYMALGGEHRKVDLYSTDREKAEWIGRDKNSEWQWKW